MLTIDLFLEEIAPYLVTPGTQRTSKSVVMSFTVGESLMLKKCSVMEGRIAFFTDKTVWVPLK